MLTNDDQMFILCFSYFITTVAVHITVWDLKKKVDSSLSFISSAKNNWVSLSDQEIVLKGKMEIFKYKMQQSYNLL
jgi:hypothetical protein